MEEGGEGEAAASDLTFLRDVHNELEQRKNEVLGSSRFIASLSNVDGVVLLDRHMVAHAFGVELAPTTILPTSTWPATCRLAPRLRCVDLAHFGTRHRAMMRLLPSLSRGAGIRRFAGRRHPGHDADRGQIGALGEHRRAIGLQGRELVFRRPNTRPSAAAAERPREGVARNSFRFPGHSAGPLTARSNTPGPRCSTVPARQSTGIGKSGGRDGGPTRNTCR